MYYILKKGKPDGHGAIRSITFAAATRRLRWFRCYPSRLRLRRDMWALLSCIKLLIINKINVAPPFPFFKGKGC